MPTALPSFAAAARLFLTFQANVEHLERSLNNLRKRDAREKRSQNPLLVFKDIRAEGPSPVETLLSGPQSKVAQYDQEECAIILTEPMPLAPGVPVTVDHKPCGIIHAEPDRLWLDSTEPVSAGAVVRQEKLLGSVPELFAEFNAEWGRRWNKHVHLDVSDWQGAVATAMVHHRADGAHFPGITPALWRSEVRRKKASTAAGLDGVSRQDLLLLPDDLLQHVLDTYAHAVATGVWPIQPCKL